MSIKKVGEFGEVENEAGPHTYQVLKKLARIVESQGEITARVYDVTSRSVIVRGGDHGQLIGLEDNDHLQYLMNATSGLFRAGQTVGINYRAPHWYSPSGNFASIGVSGVAGQSADMMTWQPYGVPPTQVTGSGQVAIRISGVHNATLQVGQCSQIGLSSVIAHTFPWTTNEYYSVNGDSGVPVNETFTLEAWVNVAAGANIPDYGSGGWSVVVRGRGIPNPGFNSMTSYQLVMISGGFIGGVQHKAFGATGLVGLVASTSLSPAGGYYYRSGTVDIRDGRWHHVAVGFKKGTASPGEPNSALASVLHLWIDGQYRDNGVVVNDNGSAGTLADDTFGVFDWNDYTGQVGATATRIGSNPSGGFNCFSGHIGSIMASKGLKYPVNGTYLPLWNLTAASSDILFHLVHHEGSGLTLADAGPNNYTVELSGNTALASGWQTWAVDDTHFATIPSDYTWPDLEQWFDSDENVIARVDHRGFLGIGVAPTCEIEVSGTVSGVLGQFETVQGGVGTFNTLTGATSVSGLVVRAGSLTVRGQDTDTRYALSGRVPPNERAFTAGSGLTGGGTLAADFRADVGPGWGITVSDSGITAKQSDLATVFQASGLYELSGTSFTKAESDVRYAFSGTGGSGGSGLSGSGTFSEQFTATGTYQVNHGLVFYPQVTVLDSGLVEIEVHVTHLSLSGLRLDFLGTITSGRVICDTTSGVGGGAGTGGSSTFTGLSDVAGTFTSGQAARYDGTHFVPWTPTLTTTSATVEAADILLSQTLSASQASFSISGFAASGYDYIEIEMLGRTDNAGPSDHVNINFNGDTTASNYRSTYHYAGTTTNIGDADARDIGEICGATAGSTSFGALKATIPAPGSAQMKAMNSVSYARETTTTSNYLF